MLCDVNENGSVDFFDILGIFFTIHDPAEGLNDPRDWDSDGTITVKDARGCARECTRHFCLPVKSPKMGLDKNKNSVN